jgi:hypothetical protein
MEKIIAVFVRKIGFSKLLDAADGQTSFYPKQTIFCSMAGHFLFAGRTSICISGGGCAGRRDGTLILLLVAF